ncbi:MAG: nitrate reductase cytochrome c-type subunit [Planctomycetaceae bacterium]|nr:nitrate reductase cytochrome c-type subunit [Planctomycetaceae bacterium]
MSEPVVTTPLSVRSVTIFGAVAVGVGLVGFLVGIAEPVQATRAALPATREVISAEPAPSYREINSPVVGPNAGWSSPLSSLKQDRPELFAQVVRTPEMKEAALRDRLRTRAFDEAPPVIPHRVEHQSANTCLVCHGEGLKLGEKIATKVSHPHFANCLQCHVEQVGTAPTSTVDINPTIANEFVGIQRSGPGSRAMPGAPPTIPHTTHLRNDCLSCHGLVARPGLRTTHPWLSNCVQCHVGHGVGERPQISGEAPLPEGAR